ncbi:hypothetical protein BB561_005542 [Smittium simulii]|uniref:DUF4460 domain-containing protein n=1 Tax=Smittium simulii TaxID=133385 RepID=A0A2T9Y9X1_9FUNG|nr:hypothetical protein BB561_005542 [Smittium simulii]
MNQIKSSYRQFLKQIHPDFFHNDKVAKDANAQVIWYFQQWIDNIDSKTIPSDQNNYNTKYKIIFPQNRLSVYFKNLDNSITSNKKIEFDPENCFKDLKNLAESAQINFSLENKNKDKILISESKFLAPLAFLVFAKALANKEAANKNWNNNILEITESILSECKKQNDSLAQNLSPKNKIRALRLKEKLLNEKKVAEKDFNSLLRDSIHAGTNFLESKKKSQKSNYSPLALDRSKIYFDNKINPSVWISTLDKLEKNLKFLEYHKWHDLPVMIVNNWDNVVSSAGVWHYPGFVTIPINSKIEDLKIFLDLNLNNIKHKRMAINLKFYEKNSPQL